MLRGWEYFQYSSACCSSCFLDSRRVISRFSRGTGADSPTSQHRGSSTLALLTSGETASADIAAARPAFLQDGVEIRIQGARS